MSDPWMKFYPSDWRADPALRMCSLAARGLWAEMMCIMHEAEPYGHLLVNGVPLNEKQLASLSGGGLRETVNALAELESCGVFSKTDGGVIYSRRMKRDKERAERDKANGGRGGNPRLKAGVNPEVKAQKPEARDQMPTEKKGRSQGSRGASLPDNWMPTNDDVDYGIRLGLDGQQIVSAAEDMRLWAMANSNRSIGRKADWSSTFKGWMRRNKQEKPNGKPTVVEAMRAHIEGGISFGPKPQLIPSTAGGGPVRMLPERGGERPGDVHGGSRVDPVRILDGSNPARDGPEDGAGPENQLAADRARG